MRINVLEEIQNQKRERLTRSITLSLVSTLNQSLESRGYTKKKETPVTPVKVKKAPKQTPVEIEIDSDTHMSMLANRDFQLRNGASEKKYQLSDFGLSWQDLKATRVNAPMEIKPIQSIPCTPESPRYTQKIFSIPNLKKAPKRPKGNMRSINMVSFVRRKHVLSTIGFKSDMGTLGKPITVHSDSPRFVRIFQTTLNLSNGVNFAIDIIGAYKSLENLATQKRILPLKVFKRIQKMQAQSLEHEFQKFVTGFKTKKAILKALGIETPESTEKTRDRKETLVYVSQGKTPLTFVTQNYKVDYVCQYRKIESLGIKGLTKVLFDTTKKQAMESMKPITLKLGKYTLTFKPIDSKQAKGIQANRKS